MRMGSITHLSIRTLLDMGRGGYLTGQALKDYEAMKDMNCEK